MAINYKTPSQAADEYLVNLKVLKPSVNTKQTDSDWWIRSRVVGGVAAGLYADQKKIADDVFPQSARKEANERHLEMLFGSGFIAAQPSVGLALLVAATGSTVTTGLEFVYEPNGNTYQATEDVAYGAATAAYIPIQSVSTGQSQNLLDGASLTVSSPPAGVEATAVAFGNISDGRNDETNEEASARILARYRSPIAGGTESDYEQYARDADPSVTSAKVFRFLYGLGTVGISITSGTTDIDEAIDNDEAIVRIPSDELLETVMDYVDAVNPLTDCLFVIKPVEVEQDVTVRRVYKTGFSGATIVAGQTLTLDELLEREVSRALYKVGIGGTKIGASGYVLASEIEENIDLKLSASPYNVGTIADVLVDRQVLDLSASGSNRGLGSNEIVKPGVITFV